MKEIDDVQQLLRLKRYESPGEEYFEEFAEKFKDRQRAEMLQQSARSILMERVSVWFDEMSPSRWATPVAAAAGICLLAGGGYALVQSQSTSSKMPMAEATGSASTLPQFEEPAEETIELSLPKPSNRVPGEAISQNGQILTVRAGGFREL